MIDLLANWTDLDSEQRELVLLLLQEQGVDIDQAIILPQKWSGDCAPVSFAQQRLWFLDQLTPGSAMYNIPSAVRLLGRLDVEALHRALNEVVRRHEVLRTVFRSEQDEPVQVVLPELVLPLPMIDLRSPAADGADPGGLLAVATRLAAEEAQRPFNLATGPLLRATLLRLGDEDHVLLFTMHHIVADGWSVGVLINEVASLYAAFRGGAGAPVLPDLPIQYRDFAAWQRRVLGVRPDGSSPLQEQLDYWREQLADSPPLLEMPTDRPRPAIQTAAGAVRPFSLSRSASEQVKRLARAEEATPFMLLLAAFQTLLHRYAGQDDICVGTPVANRARAELEPLIGFFANTLVIRARFDVDGAEAGPTFRQLLRQVRARVIEAQAHQDVQFEMLVEELRPQRAMSYTPLFQAMFSYQQAAPRSVQLPGLTLSPLDAHSGTAKFDLLLNVADMPEGFTGSLEYNTDLFDAATIDRLLGHFQVLVEGILADPDRPVSQLPLLTAAEQQTILAEWSANPVEFDTDATVHARFSQQARNTPDAVAVVAEQPGGLLSQLTFRELDERSNRLAHHLIDLGVQPGQIVGLMTERSTDTLVGLFGILKAGGAYLPIDPTYPADRVRLVLEDAAAPVLVTQQPVWESLNRLAARRDSGSQDGQPDAATCVFLDADWPAISQAPIEAVAERTAPDQPAYVIYTSGSTGRPKGAVISHRNALNLAAGLHYLAYAPSPRRRPLRISLNAPLAFDASVQQWVMLLYGHTLVVIPQEIRGDAAALLAFIRHHRLDQFDCVPSQLKLLLAEGFLQPGTDWTPSIVFPGGEAIDGQTWAALAAAPATDFFNMYGPTECTVDSTTANARLAPGRPTIGRPLPNVRVYVLDRHLQPTPIGIPGELFIGGAGVGLGYLNRPGLTAERFVPDPFANQRINESAHLEENHSPRFAAIRHTARPFADSRLYRTGDLVRWLPDGNLEFLGRTDFQVKVRGFRIELGEIEEALRRHAAIEEAVVLAREDRPGDKRLVAYYTSTRGDDSGRPTVADLRRHLLATLPEYMVPSTFVPLDAMPLTPNRKIDRKALPAPDASLLDTGVEYTPPRTPTEEVLAGIWMHLLGVARVGVHDDFFALGGHSLSATQLVSRVRDAFQIELPLRSLFETPTVAGLADTVNRIRLQAVGLQAPPIERLPRSAPAGEAQKGPLSAAALPLPLTPPPLSFAQLRLWFLDQLEPGSVLYNIPAAIRLSGQLDVEALTRSVNEMVRRHEALRTTFQTIGGQPRQQIAAEVTVAIPVVDLRGLADDQQAAEVERLATDEARRPFDLTRGPLLRGKLLRTADDEHIILLTVHHIVSDGWSTGIMVQEIAALYPAFSAGLASPLPPLSLQYADYAAWQRQWLQGEVLERQLAYWKEQLAGSPPLLELPTDRPRPAVQSYRGANEVFSLPKALSDAINDLSRREGVTLFMTLLAAFQTLLFRYTGQDDICVGTPIANRTRAETENLIGFFVNTLVMRTRLDGPNGRPSFREVLKRVREAALGAYAHQDVPFEMLVDALQPQRNLSYSPLFQVMLALQNAPTQALKLPGLTLAPIPVHSGATPFDLSLVVAETPQGLNASFEYNPDLFDPETIRAMARHFEVLLAGIVADPDQPINRLPILPADERELLLTTWNATEHDFPAHLCIHELFARQAAATPDAEAVRFVTQVGDGTGEAAPPPAATLTYAELDARANQLAHRLRRLGVGPETLVGVYIERSAELIVAILGVLKSGAAWLPLDPGYPVDRLTYMLQDARVAVVLSQRPPAEDPWLASIPDTVPVIVLEAGYKALADEPTTEPTQLTSPDNLAYVIYTSGSTGRPKGILLHHRGLNSFVHGYIRRFGVGPGDRVMQFSSPNFDASIAEMFTALLSGATLVLAPRSLLLSIEALPVLLREQAICYTIIPPAMLAAVHPPELPALRTLESGGDVAPVEVAQRWGLGRRFFNGYGPTEVTIGPTLHEVTDIELEIARGTLSIGRPVDNMVVYVVDQDKQPTPIGVPGELLIGGVGVARGYLGRPGLTAERFVPNPFRRNSDAETGPVWDRLYRTGDLVRLRRDGNIEFLGRIDQQVKIRGFRIELGEVEEAVRSHPALREAAVTVHDDPGGGKRLVAYIVPRRGDALTAGAESSPPTVGELREFLLRKLPDYMVPSAFVVMDALPLNPSGKIDRRRLPAPEAAELAVLENAFVAPTTPAEQLLARIWSQVLRVERVGIHDNFFELGGDSILSIQVIARANQAGLHLTPKQLFQAPTVAALAALAGDVTGPLAEQGPVEGPLPLTPIQRWFFDQDLPNRNHWNQALLLATRERLVPEALSRAVAALLAHHDALRVRYAETDTGWQAVNAGVDPAEAAAACAYHDLSALPDAAAGAAITAVAAEAQKALDIARGPLLHVSYLDLGPDRAGRLLLVGHHLAVDGVSWRILLEDLLSAYQQAKTRPAADIQLPLKTTSFKAWATQLAAYAQSDAVLADLDTWLAQGQGWIPPLPTDFDADPAANTESSAEQVGLSLTEEETRALLQDVPPVYRTEINDILLTALAQTMAAWTESPTLWVHLEGHGREEITLTPGPATSAGESAAEGAPPDVSRTVGWFTTLYPVRLNLPEEGGPGAAIKLVKEQLRAIPQRGLSYGLLRYLHPDPDVAAALASLPEPELTFNYLGQLDQALDPDAPLTPARESSGPDRCPDGPRSHLFDITAGVAGGRLNIGWTYSRALHRRKTAERLLNDFAAALRSLIAHCQSPEAGGFTPSDFDLAGLDQKKLDKVLKKFQR